MTFDYKGAKDAGYSDQDINDFLKAKQAGYPTQEIQAYINQRQEKQSKAKRIGGIIGTQVLETALGAPREAGEFGEALVPEKALKKAAGQVGLEKGAETLLETTKKYAPYKLFPSKEQIHENVTKTIFGDKFEPQTETEKRIAEGASDFAALAIPLPGQQFKILKPLFLSIGGQAAQQMAKDVFHAGKFGQTLSKIGTFVMGSMFKPRGLTEYKNNLYSAAREALPQNATVSSTYLKNDIANLRSELTKGGTPASAKPALKLLDELEGTIQGEQVPIESLQANRENINEARAGIYEAVDLKGNRPGIKRAKKAIDEVAQINKKPMNIYAKENPAWGENYFAANEIHGAELQAKRVRNMIMKHANKWAPATLGLFGIEAAVKGLNVAHLAESAAVGAGAYTALETGELIARMLKSPEARKYYGNVMKAALKDDSNAVMSNMNKLNEIIEKENK